MTTLIAERTVPVLDHGYIKLIESWGADARIIEAARMSTNKGFLGWGPVHLPGCNFVQPGIDVTHAGKDGCTCTPKSGDEKLLRFLWEHKHATPFEMAGLIVEVQAPIFVFREWRTHRTCAQFDDADMFWDDAYSEMSARYTPLPDQNYLPSLERIMRSGGSNKQAIGTGSVLTEFHANAYRINLDKSYREAEAQYQTALADGVPKELARCFLPVGRYSRMRASANLRNWLGFLTLRMDPAAQWEIQQYAMAMAGLVEPLFPRTYDLFREGFVRAGYEHASHS